MPSQHDIEEAALAANAHGFICDLPLEYDTPVTDKCATLHALHPPYTRSALMRLFCLIWHQMCCLRVYQWLCWQVHVLNASVAHSLTSSSA